MKSKDKPRKELTRYERERLSIYLNGDGDNLGMSKHKIKIGIDENINGVVELLKEKGYNAITFKKGTPDKEIHNYMNENNVKAFFTKNFIDFIDFSPKKYVTFGIKINRPNYLMADIIEWIMLNDYSKYKTKKDIDVIRIISNETLRQLGCKK